MPFKIILIININLITIPMDACRNLGGPGSILLVLGGGGVMGRFFFGRGGGWWWHKRKNLQISDIQRLASLQVCC